MSEAKMHDFPELLPDSIIQRASRLNAALLCDGMKGMGIPMEGCMEAEIMPVDVSMKVVGTAITVDTSDGDNFPIHVATYASKPGYVMVIDGKGYSGSAYFGDLIMGAANAVGIKGMIIDGYVRDREGCLEIGMPVFAKGFMQRGPKKEKMGEINGTINCGGIEVHPGDLIFGDADGVTVVPREHVEAVLEGAEKKLSYEEKRESTIAAYHKAIEAKTEPPQLAPVWVTEMLER